MTSPNVVTGSKTDFLAIESNLTESVMRRVIRYSVCEMKALAIQQPLKESQTLTGLMKMFSSKRFREFGIGVLATNRFLLPSPRYSGEKGWG